MSSLTYRGIKLDLLNTQPCERRAVYSDDGTTYLYHEWHIDVIGELNPQLNSFAPVGQVGQGAAPFPGTAPALTDTVIRHILMQPQGRLTWVVGGQTVLDTPVQNMVGGPARTDAYIGPVPQSVDFLKFLGEFKTWVIRFRIVAYVNECGQGAVSSVRPPILLSNRWAMNVDVDDQHVTTRVIRGQAEFRNDALLNANLNADQFRAALIHPIPPGFHREGVHCELDSDGTTYHYVVVDVEELAPLLLSMPAVAPGITHVEAWETSYLKGSGVIQQAQDVAAGALAAVASLAGGAAALGGRLAAPAAVGAGGAGGIAAIARSLPMSYSHYYVRCWGNKGSTRRGLQRTALAIIFSRFNGLLNAFTASSVEAMVTHDLMGRYVECVVTVQRGVLGAFQFTLGGDSAQAMGFPVDDDLPGITNTRTGTTRLGPPNSNQTRGTYVGQLVAQALQNPCQLPAAVWNGNQPIDPPRNQDVAIQ